MTMASIANSAISHKKKAGTHGRHTFCDVCEHTKPDCIWTRREDSGAEFCACSGCRASLKGKGIQLSNADADHRGVPV